MTRRVAILGGGVAGMSAAHELVERGYRVEVFERMGLPGGKARSIPVAEPLTGPIDLVGGKAFASPRYQSRRPWVPGEHGFRFFPGFYRHVIDTMRRIPEGAGCVADHLVDTSQAQIARYGKKPLYVPVRFPHTPGDLETSVKMLIDWLGGEMEVTPEDTLFFGQQLWQLMTSCSERRLAEYEKIDWWTFIDADKRSSAYQKYFAGAITRSLVAAKARRASTKTIGDIFIQILFDILDPAVSSADRVLDGPTNDVWINPWLDYLRARGVVYHFETEVRSLHMEGGCIRAINVAHAGRERRVEADYFVAAVPLERMAKLVTSDLVRADPAFGRLLELADPKEQCLEWMNGIQYYLTEDLPLVDGHTIYMDSEWALTSVSQAQFWKRDLAQYGDGKVRGILSVDISDWDVPGGNGKQADECTRDEIAAETWRQLKCSLNVDGREVLKDEHLHYWYLDPSIQDEDRQRPGIELNEEPLLVNYADTWKLRPEATTRVPNLFLASDYVRTHTDLATMEAANEAARRAVNGVMDACGDSRARCQIWPLHEQPLLAPFRAYDRVRFQQGLPWDDSSLRLYAQAGRLMAQLQSSMSASGTTPYAGTSDRHALLQQLVGALGQLLQEAAVLQDSKKPETTEEQTTATAPTPAAARPRLRIVPL
ncbi:MAG TPA: FAD-dependent oxidoreductase [Polyangiaceae bacterium]|nr:FAD-dependent oxidoreductase [Polyangiaceae bacterium]